MVTKSIVRPQKVGRGQFAKWIRLDEIKTQVSGCIKVSRSVKLILVSMDPAHATPGMHSQKDSLGMERLRVTNSTIRILTRFWREWAPLCLVKL